ncbi:membrane protein [Bradyrhizobium sp. LTSPM299]|nr:membrane protein [Bradyrhizobium sp. LTSPM299]
MPSGVALARKRLSVALVLSAAMIVIYFGFMGLFAFDKPLLGTILTPGLSLCIVLGPLVIISSFLLCLIYVLWANHVFDPGIQNLR